MNKLEQLELMCSYNTPAAPRLPILSIQIRSFALKEIFTSLDFQRRPERDVLSYQMEKKHSGKIQIL